MKKESEEISIKDDSIFNDIPNVHAHLDKDESGEDVLFLQAGPFYHSGSNKKISLMKSSPELQAKVLQAIQIEMQKAFRNAIHSVLRQPFGLDESDNLQEDELHEGEYCPQCLAEYIQECWNKPLEEAQYQGRNVPLGKPMAGDVKKFKVYVRNKSGNVVKVNFGQKGVKIKKSNPARRKSFRARHRCATAKDRTTPRYWSCRKW